MTRAARRRGRARRGALLLVAGALFLPEGARADEPTGPDPVLVSYLDALAARRLVAPELGSIEMLRERARHGETLYFQGRYDEAAVIFYEIAESPSYADFRELPEYLGAEFLLARSLTEVGAYRTARAYLERILVKGPSESLFGPAVRAYVDVALVSADPAGAAERLAPVTTEPFPEDSENELRYLRARELYDAGSFAEAEPVFASITRRSRFYANAQYFRGLVAARAGDLPGAEARFCSIASTPDDERFTFFVDDRYFAIKDLAWLGLGRVAHEGRRSSDAFYYYFQVPADSERVAEAMFEAAYAMYEGDDLETADDLLDQLEARFPASPFSHEASLLRGYVHLARCEFDQADAQFQRFLARFVPVLEEVDRVLASPSRKERLHERLLDEALRSEEARREREEAAADAARTETSASTLANTERERSTTPAPEPTVDAILLALLSVDPTFYRLHADLRLLDAEAARAGRLPIELRELASRLRGEDRPVEASALERFDTDASGLRADVARAREALRVLEGQIDELRRARAPRAQIAELEARTRATGERIARLSRSIPQRGAGVSADATAAAPGASVEQLIASDVRRAEAMPARVSAVRGRLSDATNEAAVRGLVRLRDTLAQYIRRARIGRIDAVMGSKRRIEIQIESLAAGRFPPELVDPLRIQGLLREDEEYWPFEGELWTDEMEDPANRGRRRR